MTLTLTTAPPSLGALMLQTICDHLRRIADLSASPQTAPADITYIEELADAAVALVERKIGRALLTQTWTLFLDKFPAVIHVPMPPLQSVTSVKYYDSDGILRTLAAAAYRVTRAGAWRAEIAPVYGESWPSTRAMSDAIEVEFITGYGATMATVPGPIRQAIRELVAHWYENRQAVAFATASEVPLTVAELLQPYKVYR